MLGRAAREWLGALMGWAAGRENLRRHPSSNASKTVTGYTGHTGVQQLLGLPFAAADRQGLEDDIDIYSWTPASSRYVWMIRVPDGHTSPESFLADIDTAIMRTAGSVTHPK